jgi:transposase
MASTIATAAGLSTPEPARRPKAPTASGPPERRGETKPPYPAEFRREAVRLLEQGGASAAQLARELGVSADTLRAWAKQGAIDAGRRDGLTADERQELGRLRREVKRLQEEREILKKAAAFFAAESATR